MYQFTFNCDKFSQSEIGLLLDIPTQQEIDNFNKIQILVAPTGTRFFTYNPNKTKESYISDGWKIVHIGTSQESVKSLPGNMKAQRRQYGLKHYVTSTVHASMGDTLDALATEISLENTFKLWDKAQAVVLLSRTRRAKDTIFVGDKRETIKALTSIIQLSTQWMDYQEEVLPLLKISNNDQYQRERSLYYQHVHPFRLCDIQLPTCNTGFCYMLVSVRDNRYIYIGETFDISNRLLQHNSGNGAKFTTPLNLRPWALFSFVCGFDGNKQQMKYFESKWQQKMKSAQRHGHYCPKYIARSRSDLINNSNELHHQNSLRLIHLFEE